MDFEAIRTEASEVPLDQLVDVAITGPLALVACDDDVETVSGDVDVDFADP